ncbi:hypothetical protein ACKFKG_19285 [Phormidesmis sp. 146-35]
MYEPIRESSSSEPPSDQVPRLYIVGSKQKPKQFQSGIYDSSILCRECDGNLIGSWDRYGQTFLLSPPDSEKYITDTAGKPAYKVDSFDYKQLKLFFMSILWRAAITSHEFFAQVKLTSWEEKLKRMILAEDPGDENDFSVILFKYEGDFSEMMYNPIKKRQDGINFYRFKLPRYTFLIKVDQRSFSSELAPFVLSPNQPLLMCIREYTGSKEYKRILAAWNQISI